MDGPSKVNASADVTVCPFTVTVIGPLVEPAGTRQVNWVAVAETTSAVMPLNLTILFAGFALKLFPVITIFAPMVSDIGEILLMAGTGGVLSFFLQALFIKMKDIIKKKEMNRMGIIYYCTNTVLGPIFKFGKTYFPFDGST